MVSKNFSLTANGEITSSSVKGVSQEYDQMYSMTISYGSFLDESDVLGVTRDVVVGDDLTVVDETTLKKETTMLRKTCRYNLSCKQKTPH